MRAERGTKVLITRSGMQSLCKKNFKQFHNSSSSHYELIFSLKAVCIFLHSSHSSSCMAKLTGHSKKPLQPTEICANIGEELYSFRTEKLSCFTVEHDDDDDDATTATLVELKCSLVAMMPVKFMMISISTITGLGSSLVLIEKFLNHEMQPTVALNQKFSFIILIVRCMSSV